MEHSIFITGAASGIGKATARLFAERGWFVGLYDVNEAGVKELASSLGPQTSAGALDVRDRDAYRRAIAHFGERTGGTMSVHFGCAGVLKFASFVDCTPEDADRQIAINVNGVVNGIYAALPLLEAAARAGRKPKIVTMSSASAIYGQPEMAVYSATKFFVRGLTEALDVELQSKGIGVCDVMPGFVDTPMVQNESHKPKTMGVFGVKTTAEDVAAIVWKATQSGKLHWTTKLDDAVAHRLSGFSSLARGVMRRISS